MLFISFLEVYFLKQDPEKDAGDVVPDNWLWARYPDGYDVWLGDGSTKQARHRPFARPRHLPPRHRLARHRRRYCVHADAHTQYASQVGEDSYCIHPLLYAYTHQVGEEELFLGKTWKLNAERNNGRGAMMGITGALQCSRPIVSRAMVSVAVMGITFATALRGLEL